jgi:peptidoglycan hydrolase CwlO-like protein
MFKRVGGTVAAIVALVGSGFLFGQATADSQSTAAAAKPGSSQAVVKKLKKLNSKTASIDAGVAAIGSNVESVNRGIGSIDTGIASIDTGIASINSSIAAMLEIARICTVPTNNCFG